MGFFFNRITVLSNWVDELLRHGRPEEADGDAPATLVMLDGVGGWFFGPLMMRRALRSLGTPMHTVLFDWHSRPRGNMLADLMGLKRNRLAACRLARKINALHRATPQRRIHVAAYSGGCGIAVFALEKLKRSGLVDTVILLAPALSPGYDLAPALRNVRRCVVGVSRRDCFLLGAGTRLFGTIDRVHTSSAGRVGFRPGKGTTPEQTALHAKLESLVWTPEWKSRNHHGGHTAWIHPVFLARLFQELRICPIV
ncbi:MAG: alpha/beta hydrolase [Phycisphaerales bacterium]|nr:alpha/beta hydrolase [Phycisphaerales bacterium]